MANNAVVGVLRALLTADTAQYEGGMRKAAVITGQFGKEVQKLTPQAERMARAFGGDRLLAQANNLVAAVNKVGGAARLTEAEQRRVNATLTEAIAKYRALGQTAPASMLATAKATQQVDAATNKWSTALGGAKTALAAFGVTLGASAVIGFARELLTTADNLVRVADRTGLTTTEVQKLEFVARQSGNSIEDFTSAISQLQNRLVSGDKSAVAAVKALGLNFQELRQASPFEQLSQIAEAIGKIPDPAARAAVAIDLFGRQGAAILPTLISDFNKLADAAPAMSDATVRALDEAGDRLQHFGMLTKVFAAESFNFLSRGFDQFVIFLRRSAASASEFLARIASMFAQLPVIGGPFAQLAEKLKADAQFLRDAANATEQALNRQSVEVRKNTTALIDYDALLNRTADSTKKVTAESAALLPLLHEHFRWWKSLPPVLEDNKASMQSLGVVWADTLEDAFRKAQAFKEQMQEIARLGMGPFDFSAHTDNKASQEAAATTHEQIDDVRDEWRRLFSDIARWTTESISDALAESLVGLRSFKDAWLSIWQSIRRSFAQIIASMLDQFIHGFIDPMIRGLGRLAGAAVFGGGGGTGQNLANLAGMALPFLGGGGGAGAATTISAAGTPITPGLAGAGAPAGAAPMGFLANPAFWTNPYTIAAAIAITTGVLIWKKGLFRGGEEALKVNPRRDQFLAQFGDPANKGIGGGGHNLAAALTRITGMPGGGPLFRAFQMADTVKEWDAAQKAILVALGKGGVKGLKAFAMGGFVPPGATQLAILHGGTRGEVVAPVARMMPSTPQQTFHHYSINIAAWDGADVKRVLEREVWPRFNRETILNQHGVGSSIRRAGQR